MPTDSTPQAEPQVKCECGHEKEDHREGMFACGGGWVIDDKEVNCVCDDYEPAEPSPAPQDKRVIEVAPQEEIPEPLRLVLLTEEPADEVLVPNPLGAYVEYADYCIIRAALTAAREELAKEKTDRKYELEVLFSGRGVPDELWTLREERDGAHEALRDMLVIAEFDRWHCASTGRQIAFRKATETLKPVSDRQPEGAGCAIVDDGDYCATHSRPANLCQPEGETK